MNHARDPLYRRHRFPAEVIGYAVWLYFRFPLSLRMVEEMLAARGIIVSHETIRCWAEKFGREFSGDESGQRRPHEARLGRPQVALAAVYGRYHALGWARHRFLPARTADHMIAM